jgi:cytochrome c oxidase assembly protein subunit 11
VRFNAATSDALPWSFIPQQKYIDVLPGESSLAFYTAINKSDKDIIGIATYNVTPDRVILRFLRELDYKYSVDGPVFRQDGMFLL